jgi:hypothetical protein
VSLHPFVPRSPTVASQGPHAQFKPGEGVPIIDRHDRIFPKEGCHVTSAQVFLEFPTLGEGPLGHEILHHVAVIELMLDGVCMVWVGLLDESLEVVCRRAHLALATARGGHNLRHAGVICFLVLDVILVSHSHNPLRPPLMPLHATLGVPPSILDGSVGWRRVTTAWDREKFRCFLVGGVLCGDAA